MSAARPPEGGRTGAREREGIQKVGGEVARWAGRRRLSIWAGTAVALVLLAWLLRQVDFALLRHAAAAVPASVWALAAAGLGASYALRAKRLHVEWGPRIGARYLDCLHLMLTHNAAVNLLPLRAGEAGYPWVLHRRFRVPVADAAASLLRLRLQDAVLLGLFAIGLLLPSGRMLAGALAAVLLAAGFTVRPMVLRAAAQAPAAGAYAFAMRCAVLAVGRDGDRFSSWLYAAANWTVKLGVLGALLASLASLDAAAGWRGALGGELAAVLPLQGPANLGTYEAGVWAAVALRHTADMAPVAGAALALHLFGLASSLVAFGAVQLAWRPALSNARSDR